MHCTPENGPNSFRTLNLETLCEQGKGSATYMSSLTYMWNVIPPPHMTAVGLSRCQGAPLSMKPDLPHARNHYFDTHGKLCFMFLCPLNPNVFAMDVHTYPYVCIAATYSIPVFTNLVHLSLICHSPTLFYLLHFVCARSQVMSVVFHS